MLVCPLLPLPHAPPYHPTFGCGCEDFLFGWKRKDGHSIALSSIDAQGSREKYLIDIPCEQKTGPGHPYAKGALAMVGNICNFLRSAPGFEAASSLPIQTQIVYKDIIFLLRKSLLPTYYVLGTLLEVGRSRSE